MYIQIYIYIQKYKGFSPALDKVVSIQEDLQAGTSYDLEYVQVQLTN